MSKPLPFSPAMYPIFLAEKSPFNPPKPGGLEQLMMESAWFCRLVLQCQVPSASWGASVAGKHESHRSLRTLYRLRLSMSATQYALVPCRELS
jgi:hypothetical protein